MAEVLRAVNILIPVSAVSDSLAGTLRERARTPANASASFGERLASVLHATRSDYPWLAACKH